MAGLNRKDVLLLVKQVHNTESLPKLQTKTLPLLERAKRMLRRRRQIERACSSGRFRKNGIDARRCNISKINEMTKAERITPSLMTDPLSPSSLLSLTDLSTSTPHTHTDASKLKALISQARDGYGRRGDIQIKSNATKQAKREHAARRLPPVWPKVKEIDRAPFYAQAVLCTGRAVAFRLNFSPKTLEAAQNAKEGTFHNLRSRISRNLKKAAGDSPSLFCALDTTKEGRLHIHGVVSWPGDLESLRDALFLASGVRKGTPGAAHQVWLKADQSRLTNENICEPVEALTSGYGSYSVKHAKRLKAETNHSVVYADPALKRRAEELCEADRQRRKAALSINTDLTGSNSAIPAVAEQNQISADHRCRDVSAAINYGCDYDYGYEYDSNHQPRTVRDHLPRHGFRDRLTGSTTHRHRLAPGSRAPVLRPDRPHQRRRLAGASRPGSSFRTQTRRADLPGARAGTGMTAKILVQAISKCVAGIAPIEKGAMSMTITNSDKTLDAIRDRIKARIKKHRVEIGRDLIEAKAILPHGEFGPWVAKNLGWSESTALNFMRLAGLIEKTAKFADLPPSAAMALAAPSTPETVKSEVLADLDAGKKPTVKEVKEKIAEAKKPKRPAVIEDVEYSDITEGVKVPEKTVEAESAVNQTLVKILKEASLDSAKRAFEAAFPDYVVAHADELESMIDAERKKWTAEIHGELKAA